MTLSRPAKCKVCKQPATMLVGRDLGRTWVCSEACGATIALKRAAKEKARKDRESAKAQREAKQRLKTLDDWLGEAQVAFNAYIRARDEGKPCISCGAMNPTRWDAGHYRSVGAARHLRFNEDNCHRQCSRPCNKDRSGDHIRYRVGLVARIGLERVETLEKNNGIVRYTVEDARAIKTKYVAMRKDIEMRLMLQ